MKWLWLSFLTSSLISMQQFLGLEAARKGCRPQGLSEVESSWHWREERFRIAVLFFMLVLHGGVCVCTPSPSLQSSGINLKAREFGPSLSAQAPFSILFHLEKPRMGLGRESIGAKAPPADSLEPGS